MGEQGTEGTKAIYAQEIFKKQQKFKLGGITFMIHNPGQAHTPGDSYVWLPEKEVMFTGDMVYVERMLGVLSHSNSKSWINAYETMSAHKPRYLIPGHGKATDLAQAKKDTYDYLVFLRESVAEFMEKGGEMTEISRVDQSKFNYLLNYEILSGRNAQQVFMEMEWE